MIMTTRTYLGATVPELTDNQIKDIYVNLDIQLNNTMLTALLYGIYTGVVAVTLWAVASRSNDQNYRKPHFLVVVILFLYLLTTFNLYFAWVEDILTFITNGSNFWTRYTATPGPPILLTAGISAVLNTNLADATLIWRCWIVWGRSWRVVILPIACATLATVSRGIIIYYSAFGSVDNISPHALFFEHAVNWAELYVSLIMATLLWCTILIVYRILRVGGAAGRMHVYQRVIEMLVESASLYTVVLVVLLVFEVRNEVYGVYIQELAIAIRGIAPTILVGRVAAGHARPDDSWNESSMASSLRFQNHSSSQNDSQISAGSGRDTPSPQITPDLEKGLEDRAEIGLEDFTQNRDVHDCPAHLGTSNSGDRGVL